MLRILRYRFLSFIILLSCLAPFTAWATPTFKIESPASKSPQDQVVIFKIHIEWPQTEGPYEINSPEPALENLTLLKQSQSQETGATARLTITYEFQPVKRGAAAVRSFEVRYRRSAEEPWSQLLVPEQNIEITYAFPFKKWLGGIGILILAILAGWGVILIWKTETAKAAAKLIPPPDPKQKIYREAEEAISIFTSSDPKEKLSHWSGQLKRVVQAYYDIPAGVAAGSEILSILKSRNLPTGEWNEVSRIFSELEQMKFSRQELPAHELDGAQKTLLQYVKGKIIIENSNP